MNIIVTVFIISLIAATRADIVKFKSCSEVSTNCTIKQVMVDPCPDADKNLPCVIKKGTSAQIEFEYEGKENVDGLETKAYWTTGAGDLPLIGMDTDGCKHTECPTKSGQQKFTYALKMSKAYPARRFDVKWRLFKENEMDCCMIFKIKLVA